MEENIEQEEQPQIATNTIPLFIKKLWKIVNDKDTENIISWNETGDSFVIHDQIQFITKLLPHYFKHNNMASFVRQLNFYNFHKSPNTKDEIQFTHTCFMKDVPEILPFIRRKNPVLKQKAVINHKEHEVEDLLTDIKKLKGKHNLVDKELAMLKQENAALWSELNALRLKYTKQSTIINMLIHFLITYIHSHQTSFTKPNIQVSTSENSRNNIKVGPTLLEIGYKNNNKRLINKTTTEPYTVIEPGTSSSITYSVKLPENGSEKQRPRKTIHSLEEMLAMEEQAYPSIKRSKKRPLTYSIKLPGNQTENLTRPEVQMSLLEILKENERLCEEDTDQIFQELDTEPESLNDLNDQQTSMEDIPEDSPAYTISYPAEYNESNIRSPDYSDYIDPTDCSPIKVEHVETDQDILTNETTDLEAQNNTITKEIPIKTETGTMTYTITHPKDLNLVNTNSGSEKVNTIDSSIIKHPSLILNKPKYVKIPAKNLKQLISDKNIKPVATKTNLIKISPKQSAKQALIKHNFAQNIKSSKSTNPEGTLLEILKENEKLTNETPLRNLNLQETTKLENFLNNPTIGENFANLYSDDAGSSSEENHESRPVLSRSKSVTKDKSINITDNPKENLSMYVDETQEEIDMLQDILNDLTSKDLSEILNVDPPAIDIDLENEEVPQDGETTDEPMDEYINIDESVDKYFKNNFLDLGNS